MNTYEKLAILTALEKAVKARIKEVRAEANEDFEENLETNGIKKRGLMIDGHEVGEISATYTSPTFKITSPEFEEFALTYGLAAERKTVKPEYLTLAADVMEDDYPQAVETKVEIYPGWEKYMNAVGDVVTYLDSGEIVPGVKYVPKEYKGSRVTGCKPEDVIPIVGELGGVDQLLLGDGNE